VDKTRQGGWLQKKEGGRGKKRAHKDTNQLGGTLGGKPRDLSGSLKRKKGERFPGQNTRAKPSFPLTTENYGREHCTGGQNGKKRGGKKERKSKKKTNSINKTPSLAKMGTKKKKKRLREG